MRTITLHILNESVVNLLMSAADLTDNGRKVFCHEIDSPLTVLKVTLTTKNRNKVDSIISMLLNNRTFKGLNPVFAKAVSDNGFVGVYWRSNINQISNGQKWMLYHQFVNFMLSDYQPELELNENMTIRAIILTINKRKTAIRNLNKQER